MLDSSGPVLLAESGVVAVFEIEILFEAHKEQHGFVTGYFCIHWIHRLCLLELCPNGFKTNDRSMSSDTAIVRPKEA